MRSLRTAPALLLLALAPLARAEPTPAPAKGDLDAARAAAEAAYRAGDYRGAARRYRDLVADLEGRPIAEAPASAWTAALLDLARAEGTVGNGGASRVAMERVLAVEPALELDPDLFSPALRREFELARARVAAMPRHRLRITSAGEPAEAWVQGMPVGEVPAEVLLPAGRYRVGVRTALGEGGRTVELVRDEDVEIAVPRAPDLRPTLPQPVHLAVEPAHPDAWMRPAAWATTGVAVAAAGVAVWQGVAAAGSYSDAKGMLQPDGSLRPGVDPGAYAAAVDAYASERRNAWIAGGSAVALGAAATVLWLLAPAMAVEPAPGGAAIRF